MSASGFHQIFQRIANAPCRNHALLVLGADPASEQRRLPVVADGLVEVQIEGGEHGFRHWAHLLVQIVLAAATDRRSAKPWTGAALALIEAQPGTRAADLAASAGLPTAKFKANVRRLKALGLTQSLEVGYRLTDLGQEVAAALRTADE